MPEKISKSRGANHGFTMIELLMVIMLVALLGAVALPQYLDFRREGRLGSARHRMGAMRSAILNMKAQMVLRCNVPGEGWPTQATINSNDVVASGDCTAQQIPSPADRKLTEVPFQSLPSLFGEEGDHVNPVPYVCDSSLRATAGNILAYSPDGGNGTSLWCYNNAGEFWAESTSYPEINSY